MSFFTSKHSMSLLFPAVFIVWGTLIPFSGCQKSEGDSEKNSAASVSAPEPSPRVFRNRNEWEQAFGQKTVSRVVPSGSGMARLLVYMNAVDQISAVDEAEHQARQNKGAVPYQIAWPELADLPIAGGSNGRDNPEQLLTLSPVPELIIKTDNPGLGTDPEQLVHRTRIPVLLIQYGDLNNKKATFYETLRLLGAVLGKSARAEEVIQFFEQNIEELRNRVANLPESPKHTVYLGGVSYRGAHGFNSTSPDYLPFQWLNLPNVAASSTQSPLPTAQAMISREQILHWDPDYLFLDLGTLSLGSASGLEDLRSNPLYKELTAVRNENVFALLPQASYNTNYESQLINAWALGVILYPEQFSDIDIFQKADEIFTFLLGRPVMDEINRKYGQLPFQKVPFQHPAQ